MRRSLPFVLVLVLAAAVTAIAPAPRTPTAVAQSQQAPGLSVVRAVYDILMDQFYRPLEQDALLQAAWDGIGQAAVRAGLPQPAPLGPLPAGRNDAFAAFGDAYAAYLSDAGAGVDAVSIAFVAAAAMARSPMEGHTGFLPPDSYRSFLASLGGTQTPVGLGLRRSTRPPWIVTAVAPDGPAERAGVIPGDLIVAADGTDVTQATAQEFTRALAGAEGSTVTLTVDRGGERRDFAVTRGPFYFPPLSSRLLPDGVGYVKLENFVQAGVELPNGTELISDFDRRLDDLDAQGVRALILDLRGNPGGDVFTTAEILGRFLPETALSVVRFDARGHLSNGIVGGLMRRVQHPIVVLVDGGSASSSEVSASTLRESGRALLVGQRTAGVLATSQVLPLPEGAGLQVAVAEQLTSGSGSRIDEEGFPVDIEVRDTRTAADYLAGRDPQLEAAIAALAQAPPPPAFQSVVTSISAGQLRAMLSPYVPDIAQIPTNDRLTEVVSAEAWAFTHPNQLMNFAAIGARDPVALQPAIRARGWLGTVEQGFSLRPLTPPTVTVQIDLYATAAGAEQAVASNDYPDVQEQIAPLVLLGDQSVSYRGIWIGSGALSTIWRHGNAVFTVSYSDVPGFERSDVVVAVAAIVDGLYRRNPLPAVKLAQ